MSAWLDARLCAGTEDCLTQTQRGTGAKTGGRTEGQAGATEVVPVAEAPREVGGPQGVGVPAGQAQNEEDVDVSTCPNELH